MSAAATMTVEPLSREQLEATAEFQRLSERQKMVVRAAVETGDIDWAVRQALYGCKSDKHFKIMAHDVLGSLKVQAALQISNAPNALQLLNRYRHKVKTERERFMKRLEKQIQSGDISVAQFKGMALLCRMKGWAAIPADAATEEVEPDNSEWHAVGDIVLIAGKKFRVNEVNKNGRPVDVDEIE